MDHILKSEDLCIMLCEFLVSKEKNVCDYLKQVFGLGYVSKAWKAYVSPMVLRGYSECDMNQFTPLSRQFRFIGRVTQASASLRSIRVTVCQAEGNILAALAENCDMKTLEVLQIHIYCGTRRNFNPLVRVFYVAYKGTLDSIILRREINSKIFPSNFPPQAYLSRFLSMCGESLFKLTTVDIKLSRSDHQVDVEELSLLAQRAPNISSLTVNARVNDSTVSVILNMRNLKSLTLTTAHYTSNRNLEKSMDMCPLALHRLCKELSMLEYLKLDGHLWNSKHAFCVESNTIQTLSLYTRSYFYIFCPQLRKFECAYSKQGPLTGVRHANYSPSAAYCLVTICKRCPQLQSLVMGNSDNKRVVVNPTTETQYLDRLRVLCACDECQLVAMNVSWLEPSDL